MWGRGSGEIIQSPSLRRRLGWRLHQRAGSRGGGSAGSRNSRARARGWGLAFQEGGAWIAPGFLTLGARAIRATCTPRAVEARCCTFGVVLVALRAALLRLLRGKGGGGIKDAESFGLLRTRRRRGHGLVCVYDSKPSRALGGQTISSAACIPAYCWAKCLVHAWRLAFTQRRRNTASIFRMFGAVARRESIEGLILSCRRVSAEIQNSNFVRERFRGPTAWILVLKNTWKPQGHDATALLLATPPPTLIFRTSTFTDQEQETMSFIQSLVPAKVNKHDCCCCCCLAVVLLLYFACY